MFKKFLLSIKSFFTKILENANNICMLLAVFGVLYSPLLLMKSENYFDLLKYGLIFVFFLIDVIIINRK